jgi:DNA-binding ferritin-like protein
MNPDESQPIKSAEQFVDMAEYLAQESITLTETVYESLREINEKGTLNAFEKIVFDTMEIMRNSLEGIFELSQELKKENETIEEPKDEEL